MTGRYKAKGYATLNVLELPGSRIKFDLVILFELSSPGGPHISEVSGVIPLHNGEAVYRCGGGSLVMNFQSHKVIVSQQGKMQGGLADLEGIRAGGVYVKTKLAPTFTP